MPACKFFAMGRCAFGENCTNSHDQPTTTQSNHIALPPPVQMMEPAYPGQKGITCWYFGSGYCRSGDTCPYKHDVAQLGAMSNLAILHADSAFVHQPKPVCRFYASGFCKNGDSCQLEHCADGPIPSDAEPGPERRIPAGPTAAAPQRSQRAFVEQACAKQDSAQSGLAQYSKIPCRYFARGSCNKGSYCRFKHVLEPGLSSEVPHSPYINRNARNVFGSAIPRPLAETHHLNGAIVRLGSGAEVLDLELSSDYSTVRLSSLPPGSTIKSVQAQIHRAGLVVPLADIKVRTGSDSSITADIKVRDRELAPCLTRMIKDVSHSVSTPKLDISVVHVPAKCEFWPSEIRTKTVHCLWPKPTRSAWLKFKNPFRAQKARSRLCKLGLRIDGRKLQSTIGPREAQPDIENTINRKIWVHLTNLNVLTTQQTIRQNIPDSCQPLEFKFEVPSHLVSPSSAEECIKCWFEEIGPLDAWKLDSDEDSPNVRVQVFYRFAKDARTAVKQYDSQLVPLLPDFRLYVVPNRVVEFEVPRSIYRAVDTVLMGYDDYLAEQEDYVRLFSHKSTQPNMVTVGVYGEESDSVACVKSEIGTVLRGYIAMDGETIIWDKYFATHAGLQYLTELYERHKGYIRRDLGKSTLALYGCHEAVELMEEDLLTKVRSIPQTTQFHIMCYEDQIAALEGGFREIVFTLGKQKARLNIKNARLVIKGSQSDIENAGYILENHRVAGTNIVDRDVINTNCPVCLTDVVDPYQLACGHWYCTECLESQCTHANDFPIQCLGSQGKCSKKIGLPDLKAVLSTSAYGTLIEASLSAYVKQNSLRHCPIPDCEEIYRPSPGTFDCPQCLHSVCASCHDAVHDDETCEEHQRFVEKDMRQLEEWKRAHGVKQCPKCGVSIEKDGCNKVRCGICKTPFCWVCLADFASESEVYGHMTEMHGSWVD